MWSVHTRNETTSRGYPPEVHADLPPCTQVWPEGGEVGARHGVGGGGAVYRGKSGGKRGAAGGPHRASTRVIRQPRRCRRCRRALTSTMRLVLSHTQGVSRPHILLLDAARRTSERGERPRAFHEATSERANGPRESARGFLLVRWNLFEDFSEKSLLIVPSLSRKK